MSAEPQPAAPSPADRADTDLLVYAGRLLETPAGLAHAVLEYAHAIARRGASEVVTLPILHEGEPHEVRLLLGSSVPVAALSASDVEPEREADAILADLRARTPDTSATPADEPVHDDEYWLTSAYSDWDY